MAGIITLNCLETDHHYMLYAQDESSFLKRLTAELESGQFASETLQREWTRYGADDFEVGIAETFDEQMDAQTLDEIIDEWMGILENVEFLGRY